MDLTSLVEKLQVQAQKIDPIGATMKFKVDDKILFVDGTGDSNILSSEDKESDCTITTDYDTLMKVKDGSLNPMMATMTGKIKIKGDISLAMKLQSFFQGM